MPRVCLSGIYATEIILRADFCRIPKISPVYAKIPNYGGRAEFIIQSPAVPSILGKRHSACVCQPQISPK